MAEDTGYFSHDRIQGDLDYYRAQRTAEALLASCLITPAEFGRLTDINRRTFSPFFVEIMQRTA